MKREGDTNLSSVIEGFIDCGIRDTCDGCPHYGEMPEEEKAQFKDKVGVGKWTDEQKIIAATCLSLVATWVNGLNS